MISFAVSGAPLLLVLDKKRLLSRLFVRDFRQRTVKRIAAKVNELYLSFHQIVANKRQLLATVLLSTVIWFIEGLTCYIIAISTGAAITLPQCISAICVGNISKIVSITPGGVGIYESFMVVTLGMNGIAMKQAVTISILDQLIKKGFNMLVGLPATTAIGLNVGKLFRELDRRRQGRMKRFTGKTPCSPAVEQRGSALSGQKYALSAPPAASPGGKAFCPAWAQGLSRPWLSTALTAYSNTRAVDPRVRSRYSKLLWLPAASV